jgi:putative FmdB family regulatory protein
VPRYDYRCLNCDHQFELIQGFGEGGKGTCPRCSGASQRLFHAVPVIYKGSGFYTTDYGRPKRPVENGSEKGAKESPETKPASGEATSGATPATSDGAASSTASKSEPASGPAKESPASK